VSFYFYEELKMNKKCTYGLSDALSYPQRFASLADDQKRDVIAKLVYLEPDMQQAVLNEWNARCKNNRITKPVGYLFGMLKKALNGEFRPTVASEKTLPKAAVAVRKTPGKGEEYIPLSPEQRDERIRAMYAILAKKPPKERYKEI